MKKKAKTKVRKMTRKFFYIQNCVEFKSRREFLDYIRRKGVDKAKLVKGYVLKPIKSETFDIG